MHAAYMSYAHIGNVDDIVQMAASAAACIFDRNQDLSIARVTQLLQSTDGLCHLSQSCKAKAGEVYLYSPLNEVSVGQLIFCFFSKIIHNVEFYYK